MRLRTLAILLLLVAALSAVPAWAGCQGSGCFVVDDVVYEYAYTTSTTRVMVGAVASYVGTVDANDHSYALQTNLHHAGGTTAGSPVNGAGITTGMTITVDPGQHGAFKDIANCDPDQYRGEGVVAIYHQTGPEINNKYGTYGVVPCPSGSPGEPQDDTPTDQSGSGCNWTICSPILVDLDRGGFRLTSGSAGVEFDLDRDGETERLAWTERQSGDAWLALDRDGDGTVDDGGELFGNFTDQPPSDDPHGYRALAVFDDDGDGRITAADAVFADLLLWSDRNHDGVSQPLELLGLERAGIQWIDLDPVVSRSRDRHGNELRYRAPVGRLDGLTHSVDAFLQGDL